MISNNKPITQMDSYTCEWIDLNQNFKRFVAVSQKADCHFEESKLR